VPARWVAQFVMISAAITILIYVERFISADPIFTGRDAVVSWNCCAVEWYNNQFPTWTFHYPQLLPCNISIMLFPLPDFSSV
jgi:hypothetical protein